MRDGIRLRGFPAESFKVVGVGGDRGLVKGDADDLVAAAQRLEGRDLPAIYTYAPDGQRYLMPAAR